ncbi:MAG TPA: F0F1 ATP synthase subunit gamma [Jatrophihabitantaceae bacterium]|nr:F0F1 ATP synthase subunit gamma [Jatrophihabitantaceae bacterium]
MGAQLRVYRRRIRTVGSTKKITKAMELIAASRIVRAQARMKSARPYADELMRALAAVLQDPSIKNPMLTGVENPRRSAILLITSDRGLAGGYNANAIKAANELAAKLEGDGREVVRYIIGRKGTAYYNFRRISIAGSWTGFSEQPAFANIRDLTETLGFALAATSEGEHDGEPGIDELYVVYTQFKNSVSQIPVVELVSPVKDSVRKAEGDSSDSDEDDAKNKDHAQYEFEPEPQRLIAALLPRYISARIFSALLASAASESAARRRAMKSASDNATELIKTYTRMANQARQAEITQEISEIVGGADALAAAGSDD